MFVPVPWNATAAEHLAPAFDGDARALERTRSLCESGALQLLGVYEDEEMIAACVLGVDHDEGVVHAAGGSWNGGGLVESLLPVIELGFQNAGLKSCRIETFRRGLMQKICRTGYRPASVSFRKVF